jgi:dTDP-4-dehydrorhamnose 3,5-epimerase-like enzyme
MRHDAPCLSLEVVHHVFVLHLQHDPGGQHVTPMRHESFIGVPAGFCHGFLTLEPGTAVFYKVDNFYSPAHETGLRWDAFMYVDTGSMPRV